VSVVARLCLFILAGLACAWCAVPPAPAASEHRLHNHTGSVDDERELEDVRKQMQADERRITIRQANLFQYRFVDQCMEGLPEGVTVEYAGVLRTLNAQTGQRVMNQIGDPLRWDIVKDVVVFSLWTSTEPTKQTLAKCSIEGLELFVNVDFVDEKRGIDEKMPELGRRSIREVVSKIAQPPARPPRPAPKTGKPPRKPAFK
jgi:hypothetical protein